MNWAFYDVDGNRTLPNMAAIKAQEVCVHAGASTHPGHERLVQIEYRNAQRVDGAGPVMAFRRRRDMVAWFKAQAKGPGASMKAASERAPKDPASKGSCGKRCRRKRGTARATLKN